MPRTTFDIPVGLVLTNVIYRSHHMLNNLKSKVFDAVAFAVAFCKRTHTTTIELLNEIVVRLHSLNEKTSVARHELDSYGRNIIHVQKFHANPENFVSRKNGMQRSHTTLPQSSTRNSTLLQA